MNPTTAVEPAATIALFTIGFTGKSAREFFEALQAAGVRRLVDVRLNNVSQLAAFTKRHDLEYFLRVIANIDYVHEPDLAPSKEILDDYKKKQSGWQQYEAAFRRLLEQRRPEERLTPGDFDHACLLCSEPTAEHCHRRLVAEYLRSQWGTVTITHL